jgi:hypothetical protein
MVSFETIHGEGDYTAMGGCIDADGIWKGPIKTMEGDTFYPHTDSGSLVWTTSP